MYNPKENRDLYLKATNLFFDYLEKKSQEDWVNFPIHIVDKDLDESYGSFNSFKVAEIPDYLFGIWWQVETHIEERYSFTTKKSYTEKVKYLVGSFFGDYEREVDKFKPWRCYFNVYLCLKVQDIEKLINNEIAYFPEDDVRPGSGSLCDIVDKFRFIKNEPELAFCQCWMNWNYNEEHHTRAEAKKEYKKYLEYKKQKQDEHNDALKVQFDYFRNLFDSYGLVQGKDYVVEDRNFEGDFVCSPRFEVAIKIKNKWKKYLQKASKYGYYGLYRLGDILCDTDEESNKLEKEYREFRDLAKKKYKHVFWLDDIDFFGYVCTNKRFAKVSSHMSIVDISNPEKYYSNEVFE